MIALRRHHGLGLAKAKQIAERIARRLQSDYGGSYAWRGDDLLFRRTGASGSVAVTKDEIQIRLELGLLLRPLTSRIEHEIRAFCDEHFGEERDDRAPSGKRRKASRQT